MLYTIGHSNLDIEQFIEYLKIYKIDLLLDVRSIPYSKYLPYFNKENLIKALENNNIKYIYLGYYLGGKYYDKEYLFPNNIVNYNKIQKLDKFQKGINYIEKLLIDYNNIVIMCSELNFLKCHRFILISKYIKDNKNIEINHIIKNQLYNNEEIIKSLSKYYNKYKKTTLNIDSLYKLKDIDIFYNKRDTNKCLKLLNLKYGFKFKKK